MRRRILLLVVGMTVLVVLAFAIPLIFLVRNAVAQRADDRTTQLARELSIQLRFASYTTAELTDLAQDTEDRQVSITLPDGTILGSTPGDDLVVQQPGNGDPDGDRVPAWAMDRPTPCGRSAADGWRSSSPPGRTVRGTSSAFSSPTTSATTARPAGTCCSAARAWASSCSVRAR